MLMNLLVIALFSLISSTFSVNLLSTTTLGNPDAIPTHSLNIIAQFYDAVESRTYNAFSELYEFGTPTSFYLERWNSTDNTPLATQFLRMEYASSFHFIVEEQAVTDIFSIKVNFGTAGFTTLHVFDNDSTFWAPGNYSVVLELSTAFHAFQIKLQPDVGFEDLADYDYGLKVPYGPLTMYLGTSQNMQFKPRLIPKYSVGMTLSGSVSHSIVQQKDFSNLALLDNQVNVHTIVLRATPVPVIFKSDDKRRYHFNHYSTGPMNGDPYIIRVNPTAQPSQFSFFYLFPHFTKGQLYLEPDVEYTMTLGLQSADGELHFFESSARTFTNTNPNPVPFHVYRYMGRVAVRIDRDSTMDGRHMVIESRVTTDSGEVIQVYSNNFVYNYMFEEYGMLLPFGNATINLRSARNRGHVLGTGQVQVEGKRTEVDVTMLVTRTAIFRPKFNGESFSPDINPLTIFHVYYFNNEDESYYIANNLTVPPQYTYYQAARDDEIIVVLPLGQHFYRYWPSGPMHSINVNEATHDIFYVEDELSTETALVKGNFRFDQHGSQNVFMMCVGMDPERPHWYTNLIPFDAPDFHDGSASNVHFQLLLPGGLAECSLMELYRTDLFEWEAGEHIELVRDDFEQARI